MNIQNKTPALAGLILCCSALIGSLPAIAHEAESHTKEANAAVLEQLDFTNRRDFEDAQRGFIATIDPAIITNDNGDVVWDMERYDFLSGPAPDTANPSLWRQSQLNALHGLFKVTDRIYQVRGFDLANMTLIEGDTGWIVIDPLTTNETARAALALANRELGERPVKAIIYTHSHADHFGGARGIISEEEQAAGDIRIIAPEGFMEHAISENVLVGNTMARRSAYHFGNVVPAGPGGQIGSGLGQSTATGVVSLVAPNETVSETGAVLTVDGIEIELQMAHGAEAPSEFMFYFPQFKTLCLAETVNHTLHNTYTLRGARVRDVLAWTHYVNESLQMFGDRTEVAFGSHHWPSWGQDRIKDHLITQRDAYRFIHDETLRLANHGYGPREIANMIEMPEPLAQVFANRGYYGSVKHNAQAVYNFYLGWFNGNPALLDRLPPVESSTRYVDVMGGAEAVLAAGQTAYDAGDYRWVAELVNHLVYADPDNSDARALQAAALTQMGYQAESGSWRNFYLSAAQELENGVKPVPATLPGPDTVKGMSLDLFFDFLGVKLNPELAQGEEIIVNFDFPDQNAQYMVELKNGVLNNTRGVQSDDANVTLTMNRSTLDKLILQEAGFVWLATKGEISFSGNPLAFRKLMGMMDDFDPWFALVTP